MYRLSRTKRAQLLHMLVEGTSLRATSRICDVSINTVTKLLVDAGTACAAYHDKTVRGLTATKRVQADEVWSFTYAKQKNVESAKKAPAYAGDTWTWTAIDADNKLMISWLVGPRDGASAHMFLTDLRSRLAGRVQLTSDAFSAYAGAVDNVFGTDIDYAQLIKLYGQPADDDRRYSPATCHGVIEKQIQGDPDPAHVSTSYVERQNLNVRMGVRRFTRLTNAFSKKVENHEHHLALYFAFYNWCRIHKTLRTSPAQAAGLTSTLRDVDWLVELVEARTPAPQKPGPKGPWKHKKSD